MLRRILSYHLSVEALIEVAFWLAIPYVLIGMLWAFFHAEQVELVRTHLETRLPAGADLGAYGLVAALWPIELFVTTDVCAI
ncbi:hypothetical protein [Mycobacterium sp.]|jgi:hypothetical protein|uniref:hypothetical protein n=1 Tax=Mycobacterium sp. TaxID=1785 RepID=UPI003C717276